MLFEYLIDFTSLKIHLQEFIFCSDLNSIGFCVFHIIVIRHCRNIVFQQYLINQRDIHSLLFFNPIRLN